MGAMDKDPIRRYGKFRAGNIAGGNHTRVIYFD